MSHSDIILRGEGLDAFWNILADSAARSIRVGNRSLFSLVDLMEVFAKDNRQSKSRKKPFNPRRYWSDHKRDLLDNDPELYDLVVQLKAPAEDGKMRATDFAPRLVCLYVVLGMHTPLANAYRKQAVKVLDSMSKVEIKYRIMNVDHGLEWAADSIHADMADLEPPASEPTYIDLGYRR